jgi:hypothetical protein
VAGLLLADHHGQLQFMAASDEQPSHVELFQLQAADGPCHECFARGTPVVADDLRTESARWPRSTPAALAAGFHSVHAFPLRLRRQVIGALGLFSNGTGILHHNDAEIVQALTDVATIGLLQERAIHRGEILAEQLQGALSSRVSIEQAKGVISQTFGISVQDSFELMRTYCRHHRLHLRDFAAGVVQDPAQAAVLRQP